MIYIFLLLNKLALRITSDISTFFEFPDYFWMIEMVS